MGRKSHSRPLALYMNGERVGTWRAGKGRDELQYAETWLASPNSRPISLRFPLRPGKAPYTGPEVHHYFDNLLPDTKALREKIARRFKLDSIDAFPLLESIGRDCVGALQILPEDEPPSNIKSIEFRVRTEPQIATLLRETVTPGSDTLNGIDDAGGEFRLSLAGAQEKTALLWHQEKWCTPIGATPTTHILKLPLGLVGSMRADMSGSIENEWLCSKIVEAFGLPIAKCQTVQFEEQKALSVERFDRRLSADGNWILRLPQEDMCQATGTSYLNKYESDGGPGIDDIMNLLRTAEKGFDDRRIFFACQVLFWLLAATDGHAKNFSLHINVGGTYALTPIYDVLSAYPILGKGRSQLAPQKAKLSMGLRGESNMHYRIEEIQRRHWIATAQRSGIGGEGEAIINELIARTPGVITVVQKQLPPHFPEAIASPILTGLAKAAKKLAT